MTNKRSRKRRNRAPQRGMYDTTTGKRISDSLNKQQWPNDKSKTTSTPTGTHTNYIGKPANGSYYASYMCEHWQEDVKLEDELVIHASAWTDRPYGISGKEKDKQDRTVTPDIGFYADDLWVSRKVVTTGGFVPPWLPPQRKGVTVSYPWVDREAPNNMPEFLDVLRWILSELREGKYVDIGCMGGHGRTGTILACLLVAQGINAQDAIVRVRKEYCAQAIETLTQMQFIVKVGRELSPEAQHTLPPSQWDNRASRMLDRIEAQGVGGTAFTDEATDDWDWESQATRAAYSDEPGWSDFIESIDDKDEYGPQGEEAYMEWLESHAHEDETVADWMANTTERFSDAHAGPQATRKELDEHCDIPPCMYPDSCDPANGSCWIAATRSSIYGPSEWEEYGV